jgi:putative ABC transport system permease protein
MKKNSNITSPQWANRFLCWFLNPDYQEDIQGDLEEEYQKKVLTSKRWQANLFFIWQVVRLFRPAMMRKVKMQHSIQKEMTMIRNYLKIGMRQLWKYKSTSLIHILGLSVGLSAFILIALFVTDELKYDRHFTDADRIYRVTVKNFTQDGNISRHWAFASSGHAKRLEQDYASIEHAIRFFPWAFPNLRFQDNYLPQEQVVFTDDEVFKVFDFEFIQGNRDEALKDMFSLVLTRSSAEKVFGMDWENKDILGSTVQLSRGEQTAPFKVTAVLENMPEHQHFHFEYLAPIRFVAMIMGEDQMNNVGGNYNWMTYLKVSPGTDQSSLSSTINQEFWDKYMGKMNNGANASDYYSFQFQRLLDIHLHSNLEGEIESNGSFQQLVIFGMVGILLLLVAIVNYMNLATSNYTRRLKEIGVRKTLGAFRSTLTRQFLFESLIITTMTLPLALGFVWLVLPMLNQFTEKSMELNLLNNPEMVMGIVLLLILVGIAAGSYPSLFLSRVKTVAALKGNQVTGNSRLNFRSTLVTFQYAVTIGLIFSLIVIERQMGFIRDTDPGYDRQSLLEIPLTAEMDQWRIFKNELLNHPNISSATYASRIPTGRLADSYGAAFYQGDSLAPTTFRLPFINVDEDFLETFNIRLIAGQDFNADQDMEQDSTGYYLINRTAAEALGFQNPEEIVGKPLAYGRWNGQNEWYMGRIMGVTEDFHFESLHSEIVPMVMMKRLVPRRLVAKIGNGDLPATLKYIEKTWNSMDVVNSLNYRFVDDLFEAQYQQEKRLSTMIQVFTVIAIFIAGLGLLGMVSFTIENRKKEIGIRKIMGASTSTLLLLINRRFLWLMGIGFITVMPVAYWLMNDWLENFVYHHNIHLGIVIAPLISAALITFLVTSWLTFSAARMNPSDCLKDE